MVETGGEEQTGALPDEPQKLYGTLVESVEADEVLVHQGGVNRVFAGVVEIDRGGAATIDAENVSLQRSVGVVVRADALEANDSGGGVLVARDLRLTASRVGVAVAERAELQDSSTVILLAREVHGPVETLLDTRGAILAGLATGIAAGLVCLAGGLLSRRR